MTEKQYERWKDFSMRMAKTVYHHCTSQRQTKILENINNFFGEREFQDDYKQYTDWDGNGDDEILSSEVDEFFAGHRHWNPKTETAHEGFYNQVSCCIRAGFDIAVNQSAGVVGFTCGQVRKMWNGKVPFWVKKEFVDFDNIPDEDDVWL